MTNYKSKFKILKTIELNHFTNCEMLNNEYEFTEFKNCTFQSLRGIDFTSCQFTSCDLSNADVSNTRIKGCLVLQQQSFGSTFY